MTIPYYEIERDEAGSPLRMYWCGHGPSLKEQEMSWREQAAPIIAQVIADTKSEDMHLLKDRLRAAYPFGHYGMWPLYNRIISTLSLLGLYQRYPS